MIDEKKLIAEIREKIYPEKFGERCNSLDVIYAILQLIDEQPKVNEWIPCSERLPEDFVVINVTWVNREPARGYEHIKDKPFVDTAMRFKGKWYWWSVRTEDMIKEYGHYELNKIDRSIEIIAWQYQPEPWKGE